MKSSLIAVLVRVVIVVLAACGIAICALWYPFSISLSVMGVVEAVPTVTQNIQLWTQLIFYWLVSLPCFTILFMAWLMTNSMKNEAFFNDRNVKLARISAIILFVDLAVFLIGNIVFVILGWNEYAIIYFILSTIGLGIAILIKVFEQYLKKSVKMQEETEGLI